MHSDDLDFYGHGHRRPPIGLVAAALLMVLLAGATAWSESNAAATWRAEQLAREENKKLKLPVQYEAKKRTKQKECVSLNAFPVVQHEL